MTRERLDALAAELKAYTDELKAYTDELEAWLNATAEEDWLDG